MGDNNKGPLRIIDASFNIFDSGWNKFGNHRKYVTDNVDALVNGEVVQERVERGVMVGFFGHKTNPDLEARENKDNLASHKTILLRFHPKSGDVEHKQAINRTDTGKALLSLHDSDVGNFSWRGRGNTSFLGAKFSADAERHLRFDYVYQPGFVKQNKKDVIIQESVDEYSELLKRFEDNGLVIEEAVKMAQEWQVSGMIMGDIENELHESAIREGILQEQVEAFQAMSASREQIVNAALANTHYVFDEKLMAVLTGKFPEGETLSEEDVLSFIEAAKAYGAIKDTNYPGARNGFTLPRKALEKSGNTFEPKASAIAGYL